MRKRTIELICILACLAIALPGLAQDPLSGTWTGDWGPSAAHRNPVSVELKWDGKALTGVVNPGPSAITLEQTSYDPQTGAVRMEAKAPARGGATAHFIIEGKIEGASMSGSWNHDGRAGDFKITKK